MICCKTGPKSQGTARDHCDILFSHLIRSLGYCERCGLGPPEVKLETSHWISRRFGNTRVDPDNAFAMCSACHRWWHNFPTDASDWAIWYRGLENSHPGASEDEIRAKGRAIYDRLREAANQTSKVDWFEQHDILQEMVAEVLA